MNVTTKFQSWDNLWNVIRAREKIRLRHWGERRGELGPVPGIILRLGSLLTTWGAHKQLRDPESNVRISKLLCLKLGRREGLEVFLSGPRPADPGDIWSELRGRGRANQRPARWLDNQSQHRYCPLVRPWSDRNSCVSVMRSLSPRSCTGGHQTAPRTAMLPPIMPQQQHFSLFDGSIYGNYFRVSPAGA